MLDAVLIVIGIAAVGLRVVLGRRGRDRVGVKRGVGQDWRDRREAEAGVSPCGAGASTIHVPEKQGRLAFRIASHLGGHRHVPRRPGPGRSSVRIAGGRWALLRRAARQPSPRHRP